MPKVSIVIPCYNEASNLRLLKSLLDKLSIDDEKEYLFIDDGSTDDTLDVLRQLAESDNKVRYLSFSRNFGHQNALKAGIENATGECIITMDADLQHNPALIPEMLQKWQEGFDIVYTIKKDTKNLGLIKKVSAHLFNKLFLYLSDAPSGAIGSDFRLIDRKIADILINGFHEYHLFYRGLIAWLGFRQFAIEYKPEKRHTGKSKYSYKRMGNFALDGITSFSVKPLRLVTLTGLAISSFAFIYGLYALYINFFTNQAITGWTSVILSILFIGGLQLLFLGIIGEYLGKMFFEIKKRPHFMVKEKNFS